MAPVRVLIVAGSFLVVLLPFEAGEGGRSGILRAGGGWMFATADRAPAVGASPRPEPPRAAVRQPEHRPPPEPTGHIYGYPAGQDPLFDHGTRLPYTHQHLRRPQYNRPRYGAGLPQYVKPSRAQEPVRKPVYHVPLAAKPLDNKPKYTIKNYLPPSASRPPYRVPTYVDRPNYVVKPAHRPAYDRPAYDRSGIFYGRPAYNPPVYTPEEYKPPRYAPSPFIAPPK